MKWKCLFGAHRWDRHEHFDIGGYSYQASPHIIMNVGRRTVYFRHCAVCDKTQQYYPSPSPPTPEE